MAADSPRMTQYERIVSVFEGRRPDRYPFVGRLELWQSGLLRRAKMPDQYRSMDLTDIHRDVGFGRHRMQGAFQLRLNGVEMVIYFDGAEIHREVNPIVDRFPDLRSMTPERTGKTLVEFHTPVGTATVEYTALEEMLATGARAYMTKHPITRDDDYPIIQYIVERTEFIPDFETIVATQQEYGGDGFVVPSLERIGFQQLLIDYLDTGEFFFALHDHHQQITTLMALLDERVEREVEALAELDAPYVELGDNVDGMMTNPRLFEQYSMNPYLRLSDIAHGQGKKIGSHMDGNLKPIVPQIAACGLDVIESFSPYPLTPLTVQEAMDAWGDKPIIWGGIPCPLLEAESPLSEMEDYVYGLLDMLDGRPMIFNVVDMVLPINEIERIRRIAEILEEYEL